MLATELWHLTGQVYCALSLARQDVDESVLLDEGKFLAVLQETDEGLSRAYKRSNRTNRMVVRSLIGHLEPFHLQEYAAQRGIDTSGLAQVVSLGIEPHQLHSLCELYTPNIVQQHLRYMYSTDGFQKALTEGKVTAILALDDILQTIVQTRVCDSLSEGYLTAEAQTTIVKMLTNGEIEQLKSNLQKLDLPRDAAQSQLTLKYAELRDAKSNEFLALRKQQQLELDQVLADLTRGQRELQIQIEALSKQRDDLAGMAQNQRLGVKNKFEQQMISVEVSLSEAKKNLESLLLLRPYVLAVADFMSIIISMKSGIKGAIAKRLGADLFYAQKRLIDLGAEEIVAQLKADKDGTIGKMLTNCRSEPFLGDNKQGEVKAKHEKEVNAVNALKAQLEKMDVAAVLKALQKANYKLTEVTEEKLLLTANYKMGVFTNFTKDMLEAVFAQVKNAAKQADKQAKLTAAFADGLIAQLVCRLELENPFWDAASKVGDLSMLTLSKDWKEIPVELVIARYFFRELLNEAKFTVSISSIYGIAELHLPFSNIAEMDKAGNLVAYRVQTTGYRLWLNALCAELIAAVNAKHQFTGAAITDVINGGKLDNLVAKREVTAQMAGGPSEGAIKTKADDCPQFSKFEVATTPLNEDYDFSALLSSLTEGNWFTGALAHVKKWTGTAWQAFIGWLARLAGYTVNFSTNRADGSFLIKQVKTTDPKSSDSVPVGKSEYQVYKYSKGPSSKPSRLGELSLTNETRTMLSGWKLELVLLLFDKNNQEMSPEWLVRRLFYKQTGEIYADSVQDVEYYRIPLLDARFMDGSIPEKDMTDFVDKFPSVFGGKGLYDEDGPVKKDESLLREDVPTEYIPTNPEERGEMGGAGSIQLPDGTEVSKDQVRQILSKALGNISTQLAQGPIEDDGSDEMGDAGVDGEEELDGEVAGDEELGDEEVAGDEELEDEDVEATDDEELEDEEVGEEELDDEEVADDVELEDEEVADDEELEDEELEDEETEDEVPKKKKKVVKESVTLHEGAYEDELAREKKELKRDLYLIRLKNKQLVQSESKRAAQRLGVSVNAFKTDPRYKSEYENAKKVWDSNLQADIENRRDRYTQSIKMARYDKKSGYRFAESFVAHAKLQQMYGLRKSLRLLESEHTFSKTSLLAAQTELLERIAHKQPMQANAAYAVIDFVRRAPLHPFVSDLTESSVILHCLAFGRLRQAIQEALQLPASYAYAPKEIGFAVGQLNNVSSVGRYLLEQEDEDEVNALSEQEPETIPVDSTTLAVESEMPSTVDTALTVAQGVDAVLKGEKLAAAQNQAEEAPMDVPVQTELLQDKDAVAAIVAGDTAVAVDRVQELVPTASTTEIAQTVADVQTQVVDATPSVEQVAAIVVPEENLLNPENVVADTPTVSYDATVAPTVDVPLPAEDDEKNKNIDAVSPTTMDLPAVEVNLDVPEKSEDETYEGYLVKRQGVLCEVITSSGVKQFPSQRVRFLAPRSDLNSCLLEMAHGKANARKIALRRLYSRVKGVPVSNVPAQPVLESDNYAVMYLTDRNKQSIEPILERFGGYVTEGVAVFPLSTLSLRSKKQVVALCEQYKGRVVLTQRPTRRRYSSSLFEELEVPDGLEANEAAAAFADGMEILQASRRSLVDFEGLSGKLMSLLGMTKNGGSKTVSALKKLTKEIKDVFEQLKEVMDEFSSTHDVFQKEFPDAVPAEEVVATEPVVPSADVATDIDDTEVLDDAEVEAEADIEDEVETPKSKSKGSSDKLESVANRMLQKYDVASMMKNHQLLQLSQSILCESPDLSSDEISSVFLIMEHKANVAY